MRCMMKIIMVIAMCAQTVSGAPIAEPENSPSPGGLKTDFGDVYIDNVGIGKTYNLRDLAGTPLKVTNIGMHTVNLTIDVQIPTEKMITPFRWEAGYRPIPAIDWVTLGQSQFIVPSGESAYTDVIIKIPDDPKLYGKKFQASIYSRTKGTNMIQVGVWSHIALAIVQSPEMQAEIEKNRKRGFIGNMDYTLLPDKMVIERMPLGQKLDIKKELKKTIMVANSGADPIKLRIKSVSLGSSPLSLQSGYQEGDSSWLTIAKPSLEVEGSSFGDPGLSLTIPKKPENQHKKFMFVFKVEPENPDVVGVTYYGKLYVETE
jgi:hypothetical protein